jgi:tetratricopeptide (TPR) repeat protein
MKCQHNLITKAQELSRAYAQTQSNKSVVSNLSWATGAAFFLAIVIPAGGGIIQFAANLPSTPVVNNVVATLTPIVGMTNTPQNINSNSLAAVNSNTANLLNIPVNQNANSLSELANIDINSLTDMERKERAEQFFKQGVELTKANNYSKAEALYRAAVKFDNSRPDYYHELGYALHRLKKYKDSVVAFQKSVNLGSTNKDAQKILGLNYIELKNWIEAQKVYAEIIRQGDNSFLANYNLGIAAENSGNYQSAIAALRRAVEVEPNNAKAHFELGRCYHKFGIRNLAEKEYHILLDQNPKLAEQLGQEIYEQ